MSDPSKFPDHKKEPEIIYQLGMADCPADIIPLDFGEECVEWLKREYPNCKVVYDRDFYKVLLQSGHGLTQEQINGMRNEARVFIQGLKRGVETGRRTQWPGSFQYSGMALLRHEDDHYEIAPMAKVMEYYWENKTPPYQWRQLFGDETPREFRFNREDTDQFGERNDRVLLDGPPARPKPEQE